jgi:hypothetical protein
MPKQEAPSERTRTKLFVNSRAGAAPLDAFEIKLFVVALTSAGAGVMEQNKIKAFN